MTKGRGAAKASHRRVVRAPTNGAARWKPARERARARARRATANAAVPRRERGRIDSSAVLRALRDLAEKVLRNVWKPVQGGAGASHRRWIRSRGVRCGRGGEDAGWRRASARRVDERGRRGRRERGVGRGGAGSERGRRWGHGG